MLSPATSNILGLESWKRRGQTKRSIIPNMIGEDKFIDTNCYLGVDSAPNLLVDSAKHDGESLASQLNPSWTDIGPFSGQHLGLTGQSSTTAIHPTNLERYNCRRI